MVFEKTAAKSLDTTSSSAIISLPPPPLMVKTATKKHHTGSSVAAATTGAGPETEDSRKKRCSDRYDSSESSDSGVAVLSCTDSSTASSDSSDPGSPYSSGSVEEALLVANKRATDQHIIQSSTVSSSCKSDVPMVRGGVAAVAGVPAQTAATNNPKVLTHPWTNWTGGGKVDVLPKLVPTTSPVIAGNGGLKKFPLLGPPCKSTVAPTGKKGKSVASPLTPRLVLPSPVTSSIAAPTMIMGGSPLVNNSNTPNPQTKITGFFKTQMKSSQSMASGGGSVAVMTAPGALNLPPLIKKDLTNLVIRSKEFPKTAKKNNSGGRKGSAEKKPRGNAGGAKGASAPIQGNTIKDIIMKKPVNIAPRVDSQAMVQSPAMVAEPIHMHTVANNAAALTRIAQQPQLVLTAFRVTPEMIQQNGQQMRMQNGGKGAHGANGHPSAGTTNAGLTCVSGAPSADNKGNPVQFQYPLNGSFVSFANILGQTQQITNNAQGVDGKQMANPHQQQQQLFLSQLGALGKPSNAQFILNGTLVKLANQGTTIEACTPVNRLVAGPPANSNNSESGDSKSPPTLISTAAIPTVLTTTSSPKQVHGQQQQQQQHHQPAPMFMSMAQNGQFILNTGTLPPLLTAQGAPMAGIPQTMPSLQPISLSSFAEPHVSQHHQPLTTAAAQLLKTQSNAMAKRRAMPPLTATSSPPELVLLQPIAKAMAAAAAVGKRAAEERPGQKKMGHTQTTKAGLMLPVSSTSTNTTDLNKTKTANVPLKAAEQAKEQKVMSKFTTKTEVVRQTTLTTTTTTLLETTTTMTTETVAEKGTCSPGSRLNAVSSEMVAIAVVPTEIVASLHAPLHLIPPSLTSPKSLVLEKLKLKSETTMRASGENTRLEISTDFLDVAKRQLGVLVDHHHHHQQQQQQHLECAKSPILSQPKTIRFPVRGGAQLNGKGQRKSGGYVSGNCYWEECNARFENSSKLLDHLQTHHVSGQDGPYRCLWQGCRVNGRESCSRRWLEGHVSSHGGSRTFKCIFEGCGQRFSSQLSLQKHVNIHLSSSEKEMQCSNRKSVEGGSGGGKYLKRNGKKLRYRRQPWSARMFDFFDAGIMEGLQHRLGASSQVAVDGMLQLKGRELARRTVKSASGPAIEVYVEWTPANIVSDDWMCITPGKIPEYIVSVAPLIKCVPIRKLSHEEQCALQKHLRRSYTMPLEVDIFPLAAAATATAFVEQAKACQGDQQQDQQQQQQPESAAFVAMEQDSDSGKGTQRSASAAASPVSCSSKSDVRKLKRKSKSLSPSESSEPVTEDSGLPTNTAKKHLKLAKQGSSSSINSGSDSNSNKPEKKKKLKNKQLVRKEEEEEVSPRKKSQYLKAKIAKKEGRETSSNSTHCPKSNRGKKESC